MLTKTLAIGGVAAVTAVSAWKLWRLRALRHEELGPALQVVAGFKASLALASPAMRAALGAIVSHGIVSTSELHGLLSIFDASALPGPNFGTAHFVFAAVLLFVLGGIWDGMARGERVPSRETAGAMISSGLAMQLMIPTGLYISFVPVGVQAWLSQAGRIEASGARLMRIGAFWHTAAVLAIPSTRNALAAAVLGGLWNTCELGGAQGKVGVVFGAAHFLLLSPLLWSVGASLVDMSKGERKPRKSVGRVLLASGLVMGCIMPASGYLILAAFGARMEFL